MTDRQLVLEDFADKVGQIFMIDEAEIPPIALLLKEAEPLQVRGNSPVTRPPFSLTFLSEDPRILQQGSYRMENAALGAVTLFIVPTGKDARGVFYDCTFN
jgi:hypothetical protein